MQPTQAKPEQAIVVGKARREIKRITHTETEKMETVPYHLQSFTTVSFFDSPQISRKCDRMTEELKGIV